MPYFSIIIPMFKRERFIARAIRSCLKQDFEDFEIIVVDDGSTDGSVEVVRGFTDPRIKLICHEVNRGVGPARNTGVDAATGEWIICLDSDDELLPGAILNIYKRAQEVGPEISRLQFMVRFDSGEISPVPPLIEEIWDYEGYIRWMERSFGKRSETLPVVRRVTFKDVRYYNDRTLEGPYHLDFAKRFLTKPCPDVIRLYHFDADNQLIKPDMHRTLKSAPDQAASVGRMIQLHGNALKMWAPRVYLSQISGLATLNFLSGNRLNALRYGLWSLKINPLVFKTWAVLCLGVMGPKPLAWVRSIR